MRKTKLAAALTAASALATGAYALGTQAGDGSAAATDAKGARADHRDCLRGRFGPPEDAARELGVSTEALHDALAKVRGQLKPPGGKLFDEHVSRLAGELGVDAEKVRAAIAQARPRLRRAPAPPPPGARIRMIGPPVVEVARTLGIDESKVREAFQKARSERRAEHEQRHEAFVEALAKELDVSPEKVGQVFDRRGPAGPPPR